MAVCPAAPPPTITTVLSLSTSSRISPPLSLFFFPRSELFPSMKIFPSFSRILKDTRLDKPGKSSISPEIKLGLETI